jgi:hypothetical protein
MVGCGVSAACGVACASADKPATATPANELCFKKFRRFMLLGYGVKIFLKIEKKKASPQKVGNSRNGSKSCKALMIRLNRS